MPKEETIELMDLKDVVGEETDLPTSSTRSTIVSKLKSLLLKVSGIANIINSFGTAETADSVSTTNTPSSISIDGSYLYVTAWSTDPATIDKIDLDTYTLHSTLDLSATFSGLIHSVIVKRFLYVLTYTSPSIIIKINIDSFTLESSLTLSKDNGDCIRSDGTDLYIGHSQYITKVNIKTFTETTTLDTTVAVPIIDISLDNTYLYAARFDGNLVRITLSPFALDSTLSIIGLPQSFLIYGSYLYASFGGSTNAIIRKINLNTLIIEGSLSLSTGYITPQLGIDGTCLIVAGTTLALQGSVTYIDISTFREVGKYVLPSRNVANSLAIDGTFVYFGLGNDTVYRKYIQPTTQVDSRLIDNINSEVLSTSTDLAALQADVGDASTSTLSSLYGIVGNPAAGQDLTTRVGYEGATSLADKLTAAKAALLDEITALRMAELDAVNLPADIDIIKGYTDSLEGAVGAIEGATALHNKLTAARAGYLDNLSGGAVALQSSVDDLEGRLTATRAGYLDFLAATDNNYSTTGVLDFTTEKTVFVIAVDTRYKIISPWINTLGFTVGATITFKFYRAIMWGGLIYNPAGDTITKVVGTDNNIVEFADWAHYGYTKITAVSNNPADTAVNIMFGYIKKPLE